MLRLAVVAVLFFASACAAQPTPRTYGELTALMASEGNFDTDQQSVKRVRSIALRLSIAANQELPDGRVIVFDAHVAHYKDQTAWSFPGGKIIVMDGLLRLGLTDAELAMALGHEMAHVILGHNQEISTLRQNVVASTQTRYRMQTMELEADSLGQKIAVASGYQADAMASLLRKMADADKRVMHEAYSNYPSWQHRIQNAEAR